MDPDEQPPPPPEQHPPVVIRDGTCEYRMLQPIGTWGPENDLPVYEAIIVPEHNINLPHVAFKIVPNNDENVPNYDFALDDIDRLTVFLALPHTILPIKKHFEAPLNNVPHHCTVMLFDSHVTSLRSLMSSRPHLSTGIPQQCIAFALRRTLMALPEIHETEECHQQITAGNIYYHHNDKNIKLGYAASAYERTVIDDQEGEAPINSMLEWARPPEVERDEEVGLGWIYSHYNSDIWMIGITALELAYGRIRVTDRQELCRIAVYINKNRRLPNTWQELRVIAGGNTIPEDSFTKFSESFGLFVGSCLHNDPLMRMSARLLLTGHAFFARNLENREYFENVVVRGLSPPVGKAARYSKRFGHKLSRYNRENRKTMMSERTSNLSDKEDEEEEEEEEDDDD